MYISSNSLEAKRNKNNNIMSGYIKAIALRD